MSETFTREDIQRLETAVGDKVKFYKDLLQDAIAKNDQERIRDWGQSYAVSSVCHIAFLCQLDEIWRGKQQSATSDQEAGG